MFVSNVFTHTVWLLEPAAEVKVIDGPFTIVIVPLAVCTPQPPVVVTVYEKVPVTVEVPLIVKVPLVPPEYKPVIPVGKPVTVTFVTPPVEA